jgi:hypothetical protein
MLEIGRATSNRRVTLLALLFYLGYIPLLWIVPQWFPRDAEVASAASGYNGSVAYVAVVLWSLAGIVGIVLWERLGHIRNVPRVSPKEESTPTPSANVGQLHLIEIAAVLIGVMVLYCPLFLAKYGPYSEDQVFLNALQRMQFGQRPYVDFEFLYGPLMLYPAYFWTQLFGYSMMAYYSYLAVIEALVFVALAVVVQLHVVSGTPRRAATFLLIAVFLFNVMLGPNQNGIRKFLPVIVILLLTARPRSVRGVALGSFLVGLQLCYSQEYGIACLAAIVAMYGLLTVRNWDFAEYVPLAMLAVVGSIVTWYIGSAVLLGADLGAYIQETLYLIRRFDAGEAGFRFYWTVNSLALFGLLCLACVVVARGISKIRNSPIEAGDLLLFCGSIYALAGLKAGLNRVDVWHLTPVSLVLIAAFVLPRPKVLFAYSRRVQRMAVSLVLILAATYLIGLLPIGSFYAQGWLNGLRDSITLPAAGAAQEGKTRAPTIETERSHPRIEILRLGAYLAEPSRSDRPVVFYGDTWNLGMLVGVPRTTFLNDDFLYSDERGGNVRDYLQQREDALVVMGRPVYERLFGLSDPRELPELARRYKPSITKSIASWLSTVEYAGVESEYPIKEQRWKRTVGGYVRAQYEVVAEFGDYVVLARKETA